MGKVIIMAKLLIVDDEQHIRTMIRKYAQFDGYSVEEAGDGMEAVEIFKNDKFDLVIMDIMMPELDGLSACREIRKINEDVPIIMLSARGEEYDRIHGFELGVDDYVVKPFSPRELMLRVSAVLKRSAGKKDDNREIYRIEGLTIDCTAHALIIDGVQQELSPKEYDLLSYLARNRGKALTREVLINNVWGYDFYGDNRTLDTHIKLLRKTLGPYAYLIVTLRGVGYRFD